MLGKAVAAGLVPMSVLANLHKGMQGIPATSVKTFPLPKVDGGNAIVLTIGDICELTRSRMNQRSMCKEGPYGDQPVYSTGTLELALTVQFDVWVVTTKPRLNRWDKWWADCLPEDRIILARVEEGMSVREMTLRPWIDFSFRIGAAWHFMAYRDSWMPGDFAKAIYDAMLEEFEWVDDIVAWLYHEHGVSFARNLAEMVDPFIAERHLSVPR